MIIRIGLLALALVFGLVGCAERRAPSGAQTSKDGKFTVEFVECLASCGTAPVMMVGDNFYEGVSHAKADEIVGGCK